MVQLPNRDDRGELCSYVRNFERGVVEHCRGGGVGDLDAAYNNLLTQFGARWEPEGYVFDDEQDAAMFILRWS